MKLGNRAFLLYDGLLSLLILSTFIFFFLATVNIIQKQKYYHDQNYKALVYFKDSMYNKYTTGDYIEYSEENVYSKIVKGYYCVYYESINGVKSICDE